MTEIKWWQEAVVYQIYPRSFQDSNGDGIGDIPGIIQHLPYLKKLGIQVIWLSPIYQSPNDDNGYDISDYQKILPEFGTMTDVEEMLQVAHQLGLKIMMDLVVNHTSDEHDWFKASRKTKNNPYRDYYIWRDPVDGHEPNNWLSDFGGSAWTYDQQTEQYYLHIFSKKQPDLNWDNPVLRNEIYATMTWWLNKGVDGFRMDVINLISKDSDFPDDPNVDAVNHTSSMNFVANGQHVHHYLKEMNQQVLSHYDVITVGEAPNVTTADAIKYAGLDSNELQMVFQFEHVEIDNSPEGLGKWSDERFKLVDLKRILSKWQSALDGKAWNSLYWNNHDRPRVVSRFGNDSDEYREKSAKMLAVTLHFMQGTPYIYQGEEIGMTNIALSSINHYQDIDTRHAYQDLVVDQKRVTPERMMQFIHHSSRDNARTPMQWDNTVNAGFTTGQPWLTVNPNYRHINVNQSLEDEHSIFHFYKKIIALRQQLPIITTGRYEVLDLEDNDVYAYKRVDGESQLLIVSNFSSTEQTRHYQLGQQAELLISNYADDAGDLLRPYESKVYLENV
ncbi:alpha-glucosidase [Leuconostoc carnosum]|uniref:glycoside hydrolase family 13 protein n=1 Tax=Leuconostoc TaxID=1243 RepID=UPI000D50B105|nr:MULTISPECIES: alpha-glucosidase [Leuconostoc]KAA8325410.1 alpha-glucosidase [Leuconostoc carnosum]KAA8359632.1 alpha-glucosidase [Leuconostoc carnosum]KAA8365207.1 alpha-glucosidase [Leuconostoc carnosum]KAA8367576.1 alpha-glucosidase [Leuconostoc carnosum]KAA8372769.1 alpha-glucosidase [Leuconostoc carnosum]